jgi:polyisoprenyl-phosphate glycosyltransferase
MWGPVKPAIVIIVPVYNEESVVPLFFGRMKAVIDELSTRFEPSLTFVNNASTDNTVAVIRELARQHPFVSLLSLSKNVGYQRSIEFGLRNVDGDLFVFIDVDCEDPPEMILAFARSYEDGYDVVYGERVDRVEPGAIKAMRKLFYRITRALADEEVILDMAEFSLMTREVRDAIIQDSSSFPFIRASIGRVGFRRHGIPYRREKRIAGETHYNLWGMTIFAVAGILSSSTVLLRLPLYLLPIWGAIMAVLAWWLAAGGGAAALAALLFCGFVYPALTITFIAVYLARVYKNTLGRPNAILDRKNSILPRVPAVTAPSAARHNS